MKKEIPIPWNAKSKEFTDNLAVVGAEALVDTLLDLLNKLNEGYPQPDKGITKGIILQVT